MELKKNKKTPHLDQTDKFVICDGLLSGDTTGPEKPFSSIMYKWDMAGKDTLWASVTHQMRKQKHLVAEIV